jgi:hypothetical protein
MPLGPPWFHGFNPNAFLPEDRHSLTIPDYYFIIMPTNGESGPDPDHILAHFGTPTEIMTVEGYEIWRYERLENRNWDLFLRAQLAQRLVEERPFLRPSEPAELAQPKRNLTPWDARGNVQLDRAKTLSIRFAKPVTGRMIDLAANFADQYELHFLRRGQELDKTRVPSVEWNGAEVAYGEPGLQSRLVAVPEACRANGFDEVRIVPLGRSPHFALGHFLVFDEWIPYHTERNPSGEKYHRYEGEKMASLDSTEVTTSEDASASAGKARRATASFVGFLAYGPYLPLRPGRYRIDFALKISDNTSPEEVIKLDACAFAGQQSLRVRSLRGIDFPAPGQYHTFSLTLDAQEELDLVEYRVLVAGKGAVTLDYVDVTRITPEKTSEACEP